MGMPSINIAFREQAIASIQRSSKGVVALIVQDAAQLESGPALRLGKASEIPAQLGTANQEYIKRAFTGYVNPPRKVLVYVLGETGEGGNRLTPALDWLSGQQFDYLAGPPDLTTGEGADLASWVKSERTNNHAMFKAVLPHVKADHEGVVNFTTEEIQDGTNTYTAAQYCSRIAGLLAGTPLRMGATYAALPEVTGVAALNREEQDKAVDQGELILFHDGEKVKTARAVNSLVTTGGDKGESFQKIRLVETMDMLQHDIRVTAQDSYIGKYVNSYDNKCLLITAISGYLMTLEQDGLIQSGFSVEMNLDAIEAYLTGRGTDTSGMDAQALKEANTGSQVFLVIRMKLLDVIEDIDILVTI